MDRFLCYIFASWITGYKKMITETLPTWPRERDLETYSRYTGIHFSLELSDGKTWIDIGCRTGKAMSETQKFCNACLVGVNAHKIETLAGIQSFFTEIPRDKFLYQYLHNKADLLTDVYGAFTYDTDPVAALIYETCLLKSHGKAVIISLEAKFGNKINRQDLQHFFATVLGKHVAFKRFRTYSDNSKRPLNSLRITITNLNSSCNAQPLDQLLLQARQMIGIPKKAKLLYSPPDNSLELWKIVYKKVGMV